MSDYLLPVGCQTQGEEYIKFYAVMIRGIYLFVLYGPVNPMGSCRARSVYLTTRLLGRLSPLSGYPVLCTFFRQNSEVFRCMVWEAV